MSKTQRTKTPRRFEQQANSRRAAWNRIGAKFKLGKQDIEHAKKCELSPYPFIRKKAEQFTSDSVVYYIWNGGFPRYSEPMSLAEYSVEREIARLTEIARLEQEGHDMGSILEQVGEQWW